MVPIACLALACWPAATVAQGPSRPPSTLRLSDAERAEQLDHDSEQGVDAARAGLAPGTPSRRIHGEFGAMIGSRGTRSTYGVAAIPLGDNAGATVSFASSRYGARR